MPFNFLIAILCSNGLARLVRVRRPYKICIWSSLILLENINYLNCLGVLGEKLYDEIKYMVDQLTASGTDELTFDAQFKGIKRTLDGVKSTIDKYLFKLYASDNEIDRLVLTEVSGLTVPLSSLLHLLDIYSCVVSSIFHEDIVHILKRVTNRLETLIVTGDKQRAIKLFKGMSNAFEEARSMLSAVLSSSFSIRNQMLAEGFILPVGPINECIQKTLADLRRLKQVIDISLVKLNCTIDSEEQHVSSPLTEASSLLSALILQLGLLALRFDRNLSERIGPIIKSLRARLRSIWQTDHTNPCSWHLQLTVAIREHLNTFSELTTTFALNKITLPEPHQSLRRESYVL